MANAGLQQRVRAWLMVPPRVLQPLFRVARDLRWRRASWSSRADQEFHDQAFAGADYFPFSFSYPGYVTIRRFAASRGRAPAQPELALMVFVNGVRPIHVSYHWASAGTVVVKDGLRTALRPDSRP